MTKIRIFLFICFVALSFIFTNANKLKAVDLNKHIVLNFDLSRARKINKTILGANESAMHAFPINNNKYFDLIKKLNLTVSRYPGGTWSNYWDWKKGSWVDDAILIKSMKQKHYNGKRIKMIDHLNKFFHGSRNVDVFMQYVNRVNSSPIWVLNVETGSENMAVEWLKYNIERGYPVEYWELGNEHYLKERRKKMDLPEYIQRSKKISLAMKKINRKIKLAINANPYRLVSKNVIEKQYDDDDFWITYNSDTEWDNEIAKNKFYDAIVVHDYFTLKDTAKDYVNSKELHRHIMSRLPIEFPKFMAYYKKVYGNDVQIWITEWNLRERYKKSSKEDKKKRLFYTPIKSLSHALYVSEYLLTALYYSDNIKILTYHTLIAGTGWELIRANDKDGNDFTTTANYEIFKLFGKALKDTSAYVFPETGDYNLVNASEKYGPKNLFPEIVSCCLLNKGSVKKIIVLNKWENDRLLEINIDGKKIYKNAKLTIITADSIIEKFGQGKGTKRMTKWNPTELKILKQKTSSTKLIVPKYSLTLIELGS